MSFGGAKGKAQEQYTYNGPKPYTSLLETPMGATSWSELQNRIAGRNVGFGPEFVSATTSPYATARREQYQNYELPGIKSGASAAGLGRSTVATNIGALKSQEASRDIEQRVASQYNIAEQQKRNEINQALSDAEQMANAEAQARLGAANFGFSSTFQPFTQHQNAQMAVDQAEANRQQQMALGIASLGAGALTGGLTSGLGMGGAPGLFQGGSSGYGPNMQQMFSNALAQRQAGMLNWA